MRRSRLATAAVCLSIVLLVGARKGDVSLDDRVDSNDVLTLQRALKNEISLDPAAEDAADVAPLDTPIGDTAVDPADLAVLLKALGGADVDGDGLPVWFENLAGTFPFSADSDADSVADDLEDSDGDGIPNGVEYAHGLRPDSLDSDGDGIPDVLEVAPKPPAGIPTNMGDSVEFLFAGDNPIQTGVSPGTIEPLRVAVLRGIVTTPAGVGIPDVTVSVKDHPEFGATVTRFDGGFDLAVNGGGTLTIDYVGSGLLPVQRNADVPWRDWVVLPDVVMVPVDSTYSTITMNHGSWQVATASTVTDSDGTRRPRLLFPPSTVGTYVMPGGATPPTAPSSLDVRVTEYTVGDPGPAAMPGELPPTSAYTYAIEISADEAIAAGAAHVEFRSPGGSQPRPILYLENFLDFPVGFPVPWGSYDREDAGWSAEESGQVLKIVTDGGGLGLSVDDNSSADTGQYAALGITSGELTALATTGLATGTEIWRVPLSHFSPGDGNPSPLPPPDAQVPGAPAPNQPGVPSECGGCDPGSILRAERRTVGEAVELTGIPFLLHYESDRTPGYVAARSLSIPMRGATVPTSLKEMGLDVVVGGVRTQVLRAKTDTDPYVFNWPGLDAYGRQLSGRQHVSITLSHYYPFAYRWTAIFNLANDPNPIFAPAGNRTRTAALKSYWEGQIGTMDSRGMGLGGWSLDVHHSYDPYSKILFRGDGERVSAENLPDVIVTAAQSGTNPTLGADYVATAPDGTVYLNRTAIRAIIHRVEADGTLVRVAGGGTDETGENIPATSAEFGPISGLTAGSDGSLYIAVTAGPRSQRILQVTGGVLKTVAGIGSTSQSGDGGPATSAAIGNPGPMVVGPDGTLYFGTGAFVRKMEPNGIIRTVAGSGTGNFAGDGGLATLAKLGTVAGVALGADGSLFISSSTHLRVRRVRPDGIISTFAGNGTAPAACADGVAATSTCIRTPAEIAMHRDGGLYIADTNGNRVRRVGSDGMIASVAGNGGSTAAFPLGDGGPAAAARIAHPVSLAFDPNGVLYATSEQQLRKITPALPSYSVGALSVPSRDGSELYVFDATGRHEETVDARTKALLYDFEYTDAGTLDLIRDAYGNETTVERGADGKAKALIAPFGQRTELDINGHGWLREIRNPANEAHHFTYSTAGLLLAHVSPNGGAPRTYEYDDRGVLEVATDPSGGTTEYTEVEANATTIAVRTESGEGRTGTYRVEQMPNGNEERLSSLKTGPSTTLDATTIRKPDGEVTQNFPDGTAIVTRHGPDPRLGMMAAIPSTFDLTTPEDRLFSWTLSRTTSPTSIAAGEVTLQADTLRVKTPDTTPGVPNDDFVEWKSVYTKSGTPAVRMVTTTTPELREIVEELDDRGSLISRRVGNLDAVRIGYDSLGRVETVKQGIGASERVTTVSYSGTSGFPTNIEDPLLRNTSLDVYDGAGRVTEGTLSGARAVSLDYDANGNLVALTPPGKPEHEFAYNEVDQEVAYLAPAVLSESRTTATSWASDRRVTEVDRPDGSTITFGYDTARRLDSIGLSPNGEISIDYNSSGKVTSLGGPTGVDLGLVWDGFLLKSETWSGDLSGAVSFAYESPGLRLVSETVGTEDPIEFDYDKDGLLVGAGELTIERDEFNGLRESDDVGAVSTTYDYNTFGELVDEHVLREGSPATNVHRNEYLVRDKLGRVVERRETVGGAPSATWAYTYDAAGRLNTVHKDGVVQADYAYDSNGNRIKEREDLGGGPIATYDSQDRLLTYSGRTYSYREGGELRAVVDGSDITTYVYDQLGTIRAACLHASLETSDPEDCVTGGGTHVDYVIDAFGRRIGKKINEDLQKGWLWSDHLRVVAELNDSGTVVSRFIYGDRPNVPDYMTRNGDTYRIITDQVGSVRLVVNATSGAVAQQIDYDASGLVLSDSNPGFQPFGFAGGLYDPDTGLVRFGSRDYGAQTGRWATKDLIRFEGEDTNLYAYASNDPINFHDPSGESSVTIATYRGVGGGITFGWTPGGSFFWSAKAGIGYGEDYSYDPNGLPPAYGCDYPKENGYGSGSGPHLGLFASMGGQAGPFGGGVTKQAGVKLFGPGPHTGGPQLVPYYHPGNPGFNWGWPKSWNPKSWAAWKRNIAAGLEAGFSTNDCNCR